MLGIGCAGAWYFEWIANTASDLRDVPDESVDLVFSGPDVEHLWPHEVVGFRCESHPVLRPEGVLVIDSPNRAVTTAQGWSHPQHTIELSPEEARGLARCRVQGGPFLPEDAGPDLARGIVIPIEETPEPRR